MQEKYQLLIKGRDRCNGFDISEQRRQLFQRLRRDGLNAENLFSRKRNRPVARAHRDEAFAPTGLIFKKQGGINDQNAAWDESSPLVTAADDDPNATRLVFNATPLAIWRASQFEDVSMARGMRFKRNTTNILRYQ